MDSTKTASRNIEWKIKNVTKESLIQGEHLCLSDFVITFDTTETKWRLLAYIEDSHLGLFICIHEPKLPGFSTKFEIFIRTSNNKKEKNHHFVKDTLDFTNALYCWALISVSELFENSDKYLNNGALTINAKVELIKTTFEELDDDKASKADSRLQAIFKDYFDTKSYSDVTFVCCDGTEIKAHRLILAPVSPVMKKMFDAESSYVIKVNDIDGQTMTEILRYIYIKKVNDIESYAPKLLYGAEKYELDGLKNLCAKSMIKNLSVENAVDYLLLADQYDIKDLLDHCIKFTKTNQKVLIANEENWNKLDKKHLNMILINYQENPDYVQIIESSFLKLKLKN